jgi:DNA-binding transcriptional regulator YiaG
LHYRNGVRSSESPVSSGAIASFASANASIGHDEELSFADSMKHIRRRVLCKQFLLSTRIGCSDAAISLWESGARFPRKKSLGRILLALAEEGASTVELMTLRRAWQRGAANRNARLPSSAPAPDSVVAQP